MGETKGKFSIAERLRSFRYAINGISDLIRNEQNFRIHLVVLLAVITAGIFFSISSAEWLAILFVSALVLVSEGFNTSIEHLSDAVSAGTNEKIRKAKDVAAAAVLISQLPLPEAPVHILLYIQAAR